KAIFRASKNGVCGKCGSPPTSQVSTSGSNSTRPVSIATTVPAPTSKPVVKKSQGIFAGPNLALEIFCFT
ncbi:hypothetical protein QZH41_016853, partial [Actinostola sp. cb2023]